ncbi:alpha/beta hydrolase [Rhizobium sp. 9140]|uniref:alpha/beta hydrolase n=1 Tax=Rhizobium sp. 9140 TaxID=1761900 RepID=UPI00079C960B|nr:alpha/beta hydrolase [Rhizobium sp. 9140]CZT37113.1 Alpha/beta hydrolase family protein [Rhizobium sp. 9140]
MRLPHLVGLAIAAALNLTAVFPALADEVSFAAKDGVRIYADLRKPVGPARGTILLFHMAASNKGEYEPLAPLLNKAGFETLAVDLRSGSDLWGSVNETAANVRSGVTYADTLPDLEASLSFARARASAPIALWGSSYSSALVFVVAANHPEVKALLAFSPAEYIAGYSIQKAASRLEIPVYITSAPDADEIASAMALAKAVSNGRAQRYVPRHGVHGSSSLRRDTNPLGAEENWRRVLAFLDKAMPRS